MKQTNFMTPPNVAIANGATTPTPGSGTGSIGWSTTTNSLIRWNGSFWQAVAAPLTNSLTSILTTTGTTDQTGATITIPAGYLLAGATYFAKMYGSVTAVTTASTLTTWLKLDSTKILTSLNNAIPTTAGGPYAWMAEFIFSVYTNGSSGTYIPSGFAYFGFPTTYMAESLVTSTSAIDTTASHTLAIGASQSVANPTINITSAFLAQMI